MTKKEQQELGQLLLDYHTKLQGTANNLGKKLAEIIASTDAETLQIVLNSAKNVSYGLKSRIKEIQAAVNKIQKTRKNGFKFAFEELHTSSSKVAEAASYQTLKETIDAVQKAGTYTPDKADALQPLTPKQIQQLVSYEPIQGQSIEKWFDKLESGDLARITQIVQKAVGSQLNVAQISKLLVGTAAKDFKDGAFQKTKSYAKNLTTTIVNGVSNNARVDTLKANADVIDGIKFIGTLDSKTCPICGGSDGKIWASDDIDSVTRPPLHTGCRCCVVPYVQTVDEFGNVIDSGGRPAANADFDKLAKELYAEKTQGKENAKPWKNLSPATRQKYFYEAQKKFEKETGQKAYDVLGGSVNFIDYFKNSSEEFKRNWLGKNRYEAYKSGALSLEHIFQPNALFSQKPKDLEDKIPNWEGTYVNELGSLTKEGRRLIESVSVEAFPAPKGCRYDFGELSGLKTTVVAESQKWEQTFGTYKPTVKFKSLCPNWKTFYQDGNKAFDALLTALINAIPHNDSLSLLAWDGAYIVVDGSLTESGSSLLEIQDKSKTVDELALIQDALKEEIKKWKEVQEELDKESYKLGSDNLAKLLNHIKKTLPKIEWNGKYVDAYGNDIQAVELSEKLKSTNFGGGSEFEQEELDKIKEIVTNEQGEWTEHSNAQLKLAKSEEQVEQFTQWKENGLLYYGLILKALQTAKVKDCDVPKWEGVYIDASGEMSFDMFMSVNTARDLYVVNKNFDASNVDTIKKLYEDDLKAVQNEHKKWADFSNYIESSLFNRGNDNLNKFEEIIQEIIDSLQKPKWEGNFITEEGSVQESVIQHFNELHEKYFEKYVFNPDENLEEIEKDITKELEEIVQEKDKWTNFYSKDKAVSFEVWSKGNDELQDCYESLDAVRDEINWLKEQAKNYKEWNGLYVNIVVDPGKNEIAVPNEQKLDECIDAEVKFGDKKEFNVDVQQELLKFESGKQTLLNEKNKWSEYCDNYKKTSIKEKGENYYSTFLKTYDKIIDVLQKNLQEDLWRGEFVDQNGVPSPRQESEIKKLKEILTDYQLKFENSLDLNLYIAEEMLDSVNKEREIWEQRQYPKYQEGCKQYDKFKSQLEKIIERIKELMEKQGNNFDESKWNGKFIDFQGNPVIEKNQKIKNAYKKYVQDKNFNDNIESILQDLNKDFVALTTERNIKWGKYCREMINPVLFEKGNTVLEEEYNLLKEVVDALENQSQNEREKIDFPHSLDETSVIQSLGGSTGAQLVTNKYGTKFVKKQGNNEEHLRGECYADAFYRELGIDVPEFKLYENANASPTKLSRFQNDCVNLQEYFHSASKEEQKKLQKKLLQGLDIDVLLGNWDVVGLGADNILITKDGTPLRIDNGGSLSYRAQGAKKKDEAWKDGFLDDLWTMTGNGDRIGVRVSSTVPKYFGNADILAVVTQMVKRDYSQALKILPNEEREIVFNRIKIARKLANKGKDLLASGMKRKDVLDELDKFYLSMKNGEEQQPVFFKDWFKTATDEEKEQSRAKFRQETAKNVLFGNWNVAELDESKFSVDADGNFIYDDDGSNAENKSQQFKQGWIDDLWTAAGDESRFDSGQTNSNPLTASFGGLDAFEIAKTIATSDWDDLISNLPVKKQVVIRKRLANFAELTKRGNRFWEFNQTGDPDKDKFVRENVLDVLGFSYNLVKDGLPSALPTEIDLKELYSEYKRDWFFSGNTTKTINGKEYDSFTQYISEKMGYENSRFVSYAHGGQGSNSYSSKAVENKLCILRNKGFDCTDLAKYPTPMDFLTEVDKADYYCGIGGRQSQLNTFLAEIEYYRQNPDLLKQHCQAVAQYDAAMQIVLENTKFVGNDTYNGSMLVVRTESAEVVRQKKEGVPTTNKKGVCESHSNVQVCSLCGDRRTYGRVPYSRVHGIWFIERGFQEKDGTYNKINNTQFLGAYENEIIVDSNNCTFIFATKTRSIEDCKKIFLQFEQTQADDPKKYPESKYPSVFKKCQEITEI